MTDSMKPGALLFFFPPLLGTSGTADYTVEHGASSKQLTAAQALTQVLVSCCGGGFCWFGE